MTIETLRKEHRDLIPNYSGSPIASVGTYPEKEPGYTQIPWEKWARQQAEKVAWVKNLEEYDENSM